MKKQLFTLSLLMGLVFMACEKDEVDTCSTDITYTDDVAAIFNGSCAVAGCHVNGNEANAQFSLEGFAQASAAANFGRMVGAINQESGFSAMPRTGDKLEQCDIDKITAWIDGGTPE